MLGRTVRFLGWLAVLAAAGSAWARAVSPAGWPDTCLAAACASAALGALGSMAWWWGTAAWGEPRAGKRIRTGRRVPWAARGPRRRRHWRAWALFAAAGIAAGSGGAYGWSRTADGRATAAWLGQAGLWHARVTALRTVDARGVVVDLALLRVMAPQGDAVVGGAVVWPVWGRAAAQAATLQVGDEVWVQGALVRPSPAQGGARAPGRASGRRLELRGRLARVVHRPPPWLRARAWLGRALARLPLPDSIRSELPLCLSIVFGGEDVPRGVHDAFLRAGLLHVLAASGANVVLLERAAARGLRLLWRGVRVSWLPPATMLAFTWGFAALCQFSSSIVRAAWMASYRHLAALCGRHGASGHALWFAAVAMTAADPASLTSWSAVLSFVSTAAVMGALTRQPSAKPAPAPRWRWLARRTAGWAWQAVRVSVRVEAAVAPLLAVAFGQWTPWAVVANVVADPLLACLLPACALLCALSVLAAAFPWCTPLAAALAWPVGLGVRALSAWVTWLAHWPGALVALPPVWPGWLVPYYLLWWLLRRVGKIGRENLRLRRRGRAQAMI